MRQLFNNPMFVVGIGVASVAYLVITVVPYLSGDPDFPSIADDAVDLIFEADAPEGGSVDREAVTWTAVRRDPFAGGSGESRAMAIDGDAAAPLALPAVFLGNSRAAAVVDSQLVRIGDVIGGYTVRDISAGEVVLERGEIELRLQPSV